MPEPTNHRPATFDELSAQLNTAFDHFDRVGIEMAKELDAWWERLDRSQVILQNRGLLRRKAVGEIERATLLLRPVPATAVPISHEI